MADVQELVVELAESMGLDDLTFGESRIASIKFDELICNICADSENKELTLFTKVGDIPETPKEKLAVYALLLKRDNFYGFIGSGVLGIDEQERAAYLSFRFSAESILVQHLEKIMESFLNQADAIIEQYQVVIASSGKKSGADTLSTPPAGMRV